jgi:hypothetical protein
MIWTDYLGYGIAVAIIALGAAGAIYSQRQYRKFEADQAKLRSGLDNPEMDENFAAEVAADQRARDKGAV